MIWPLADVVLPISDVRYWTDSVAKLRLRRLAGLLDLSWVHNELAPFYSHTGRPSIDPVLMIRMLIVGYVFGAPFGTAALR